MNLKLDIDGQKLNAPRAAYAKAKLKQMREFGYSNLMLKEVEEQIDAVIAGKTLKTGLTIIGGFMENEILDRTPDSQAPKPEMLEVS